MTSIAKSFLIVNDLKELQSGKSLRDYLKPRRNYQIYFAVLKQITFEHSVYKLLSVDQLYIIQSYKETTLVQFQLKTYSDYAACVKKGPIQVTGVSVYVCVKQFKLKLAC